MPDGCPRPMTYLKTAGASGAFTWSWQWDLGNADGAWIIAFRDHGSNKNTSITITIAR